jgi:nicotinamide-nucleotide amidase
VTSQPTGAAVAVRSLELLSECGATLATAESLTAGLISATLAGVPGASRVLIGGIATYATEAKIAVLGVPRRVIDTHGVISEQCAAAMAQAVRGMFQATWGVSATGVAGPDRQEGRDVGTVFVGAAGPDVVRVRALQLSGGRDSIRHSSVREALDLLVTLAAVAPRMCERSAPAQGGADG